MLILLVEDQWIVALELEAALEEAGHQVLGPAPTAAKALALAERTTPDLALLDINLDEERDGIDLARDLVSRWGVPCLFVSGQSEKARAARDTALGYINKPCSRDVIRRSVTIIEQMLHGVPPRHIPEQLELFGPVGH